MNLTWKVSWDPRAVKDTKSLSSDARHQILNFLESKIHLCSNPRLFGEPLKGDKIGLWRYRVGNYRVICKLFETELVVLVLRLAHRKDIYK